MVQGALNDDCYQKVYPGIASELLLTNLIQFVQDINSRPTKDGVDNGTLYRKANGRQIDSSRRYYLVKEPNLDDYNLYAKITKGRNLGKYFVYYFIYVKFTVNHRFVFFLGFYRIYTNKDEIEILMKYYLNYLKHEEKLPSVANCLQHVQDSKYLIARERCEFISRLLNNNVAAARDSSKVDYDVTKLGTRQQQLQKCSKETATATTVSSLTSTPIPQPCVQKQVLLSSAANNNTSRSPSPVAEHSQSPPLKKQKNNNSKLHKKQQLFKTTAEQPAPASSLRSTPILNRLRNRPDDNTTAASSSSSSNSASEPVLVSTKSKTKPTTRTKKRGHPSKNK